MMRLSKLSAAAAAALAIVAVMASSANAAAVTERAEWYVGGATLASPTNLNAKIVDHTGTALEQRFELNTTIAGLPVLITATGVECVGCVAENKEVTSKAGKIAFASGKLKFTGVTVHTPANCSVDDEFGVAGQIITKTLNIHADWMHEGKAYWNIFPQTGSTIMQFILTGAGCAAISGAKNVTGALFGEMKSGTGVSKTEHQVEFSHTIQTTTGGQIFVGANIAKITGTLGFSLSTGASFEVKP